MILPRGEEVAMAAVGAGVQVGADAATGTEAVVKTTSEDARAVVKIKTMEEARRHPGKTEVAKTEKKEAEHSFVSKGFYKFRPVRTALRKLQSML